MRDASRAFVLLLACLAASVHGATISPAQHAALMAFYDANPNCITPCERFLAGEECPSNSFITCETGKGVVKL